MKRNTVILSAVLGTTAFLSLDALAANFGSVQPGAAVSKSSGASLTRFSKIRILDTIDLASGVDLA